MAEQAELRQDETEVKGESEQNAEGAGHSDVADWAA